MALEKVLHICKTYTAEPFCGTNGPDVLDLVYIWCYVQGILEGIYNGKET